MHQFYTPYGAPVCLGNLVGDRVGFVVQNRNRNIYHLSRNCIHIRHNYLWFSYPPQQCHVCKYQYIIFCSFISNVLEIKLSKKLFRLVFKNINKILHAIFT